MELRLSRPLDTIKKIYIWQRLVVGIPVVFTPQQFTLESNEMILKQLLNKSLLTSYETFDWNMSSSTGKDRASLKNPSYFLVPQHKHIVFASLIFHHSSIVFPLDLTPIENTFNSFSPIGDYGI